MAVSSLFRRLASIEASLDSDGQSGSDPTHPYVRLRHKADDICG